MRVLVPPSKRPSSSTVKSTSTIRPPARQSSTTGSLPKPIVATKTVGKLTDGPRRILVQADDKSVPRTITMPTMLAPKTQGPQRVLVRPTSGTTKPAKKPLGPSSSINPPAPPSRLPGPSRIAVPGTMRSTARTSRPAGKWV